VRWTNTGSGEPYCLFTFVHRNGKPSYATPGMLSANGFDKSHRVPRDLKTWIGPGQSTPWSDIAPYLSTQGDFNRVFFTATRKMHTNGLVEGPIQGTLDFAVGDDKKVVRSVKFEQNAPRVIVAVPGDLNKPNAKIKTPWDFVAEEQAALPPSDRPQNSANHLAITAILNLNPDVDDPKLIDAELKNLTRMGFNGTYYVLDDPSHPEQTVPFYQRHGLQPRFGINAGTWFMTQDDDKTVVDTAQVEARYEKIKSELGPSLPFLVRMKLADEPGMVKDDVLATYPSVPRKFREYLQAQKVSLAELGVTGWEQVQPVAANEKETKPVLFYYFNLFRLQAGADRAKTIVDLKKKYFPDTAKTYVNYSPQFSWTWLGVDPFMMQREGGLEMGMSEDWLGYNASPQYSSDTYALLRAAGQGEPLGGYMVAKSGAAPVLQRLKYYTLIANGVRQFNVYNYGPAYAGVDSWSEKYNLYPVIRDVQFELGNIDEALEGTARRPAQVAILYNRTAAIWSGSDSTAELDARFIRWALSHAGYDADFIPEEDIVAGKLNNYKALYIDGIQLRRDAADKIAAWVQSGGVLFGGAGAATRDEFNRPQSTLDKVFGAKSTDLQIVTPAGRPKYELRTQKVLDTLQAAGAEGAGLQFDQLSYRESLQPQAGAKVLLKDAAGAVMATQNTVGQGTAFRLAALPGIAYLNHAVRGADYDINSYLPQDFDTKLRDFLALPAHLAKAETTAQSNLATPEITRYDAPGRSVMFVINHAGKAKSDFSMLVPDAAWATKARTSDGAKVTLQKEANGLLRVSFPLNVAVAVVLEK
jgi:hypothetical protein